MLQRAKEINWGPGNIKQIEMLKESLESLKFSDFNVPSTPLQDYIPDNFLNFLKRLIWAGPALKDEKSCISCGRCAKICPVQAISIKENGAVFDRTTCISCFCCMEVCPVDAIVSIKSPLLEMGWRLRNLYKKDKVKL
jgi:ferredoxin